jgi:hypothetical protein
MAIQVAAGGEFTCAIKPDETLACWGFDQFGQSTPVSQTPPLRWLAFPWNFPTESVSYNV